MGGGSYRVGFRTSRTTFVGLPAGLMNYVLDLQVGYRDVVIEFSWLDGQQRSRRAMFGWAGERSSADDRVEVDEEVASCLGLQAGMRVEVRIHVADVPQAEQVHLVPASADDWEILEQNGAHMEEQALNQLSVVAPGQDFPLWVRGRTRVRLHVAQIVPPAPFARVSRSAELIIAPVLRDSRPRRAHEPSLGAVAASYNVPHRMRVQWPSNAARPGAAKAAVHPKDAEKLRWFGDHRVLRIRDVCVELEEDSAVRRGHVLLPEGMLWALAIEPYDVEECTLVTARMVGGAKLWAHLRLTLHPVPRPGARRPSLVDGQDERDALPLLLDLTVDRDWVASHRSVVEDASGSYYQVIFHFSQNSNQQPPPQNHPIPQNQINSSAISNSSLENAQVEESSSPSTAFPPYVLVRRAATGSASLSLSSFKVDMGDKGGGELDGAVVLSPQKGAPLRFLRAESPIPRPCELGGVDSASHQLLSALSSRLLDGSVHRQLTPGGGIGSGESTHGVLVVVQGPKGCGKTALVREASIRLGMDDASAVASVLVSCGDLCHVPQEDAAERLTQAFESAVRRQPSLLHLDDLARIAGQEEDGAPQTNGQSRQTALAVHVVRCIDEYVGRRRAQMAVVASCVSLDELHRALRLSSRLGAVIALSAPTRDERSQMITALLRQANRPEFQPKDVASLAFSTEGYMAGDLAVLLDRADAYRRGHERSSWTKEDWQAGLEGFVPQSLQGVKLHRSTVQKSDVGGLQDVVATIEESLDWPVRFDFLLRKSPLRPRQGLLLYGPPGCGKTLVAGMVSGCYGLNFIQVAGPELLNKYIGASERAVRDAFARAEAARPCVLFFDEFDALAPKRGHDSTGVTDRVVNQLLTQLDGVEALQGVFVLAASSRPDLIDPALLRPGRLDRALYCGFPAPAARIDVVETLRSRYELPPRSVLEELLAERTDGYSGADLHALVYQALLCGIREKLAEESCDSGGLPQESDSASNDVADFSSSAVYRPENSAALDDRALVARLEASVRLVAEPRVARVVAPAPSASRPVILPHHLLAALDSSGPSLSASERARYESIYRHFVESRGGSFSDVVAGSKATLA